MAIATLVEQEQRKIAGTVPERTHTGTAPNPYSSRVSFWPEDKAPANVKAMADAIWPERDPRVLWWFGCCGIAENPDGFPLFIKTISVVRKGRYWWALGYERPGTRLKVRTAVGVEDPMPGRTSRINQEAA